MKKHYLPSFFVLGLIIASIVSGIIGDYTSGNNEQYLIMPATFMFSIWAPIYLGFLAFGYLQLSTSRRKKYQLDALRWWAVIPFILAGLWIRLFPIVPPVMQVIVASATLITAVMAAFHVQPQGNGRLYTWLVSVPLNLLAGWITLASAITINGAYGLPGSSQVIATITVLTAGLVAALTVWKLPDSRGYIAAVLWGLCGILIANSFALTLTNVITLIATLLLVGEFLIVFRRRLSINI